MFLSISKKLGDLTFGITLVSINPFRPKQSPTANESQSFGFSVKISSRSALAGGFEPTVGGHAFSI